MRIKTLFNRKKLFSLHSWMGIILGLFLLLLSSSGAILVFKTELETFFFPEMVFANQQGERRTINEISEAVTASYPEHLIARLYMPKSEKHLVEVLLVAKSDINNMFFIVVNPYTLSAQQKETSWLGFFTDLHHHLLLPDYIGNVLLMVVSVVYALITFTGIFVRKKVRFFGFKKRTKRVGNLREIHALLGYWSVPFHVVMASTSLVITFATVAYGPLSNDLLEQVPQGRVDYEKVMAVAHEKYQSPIKYLQLAPEAVVAHLNAAPNGSDDQFAQYVKLSVDPVTYKIVNESGMHKDSKLIQALSACTSFHFGSFGGFGLKIVYALMGFTTSALCLLGIVMFFTRQRNRAKGRQPLSQSRIFFWRIAKSGATDTFALLLVMGLLGFVFGMGQGAGLRAAWFLSINISFVYIFLLVLILIIFPIFIAAKWLKRMSSQLVFLKTSLVYLLGAGVVSLFLAIGGQWLLG